MDRLTKLFDKHWGRADPVLIANVVILLVGAAAFLLFAIILSLLDVKGKPFDLTIYVFSAAFLPIIGALACRGIRINPPPTVSISKRSLWSGPLTLVLAIASLPCLFFDFSLSVEPAHYLTIVGPAVHLLNGGRLLVDTFSQYGPGPVLALLPGLSIVPDSFGAANITIQIINITYYVFFLIYLHRVSNRKILALCLGLLSIAFLLATWGRGGPVLATWGLDSGNLNVTPSAGGQRYLLTLGMVLAISFLKPPARHSALTATMTALSALWSAETLFGTLAVHMTFLSALALRDRAWRRGLTDLLLALAPAVGAIIIFCLVIFARTGAPPRFDLYLDFFGVYQLLGGRWARPRTDFYWWAPMLAVAVLVLGHTWIRIIRRSDSPGTSRLLYQMLPMTILFLWSALYFVGRSIDFTILKAFLPFAAIVIPAGVNLLQTRARNWALASVAVATAYGIYFMTPLLHPTAQYSFYLQECRDHGRCRPEQLAAIIGARLKARPALEPVGNPWSDFRLAHDGVLTDAVRLIETHAGSGGPLTVLLGRVQYITYLSNVALLYTGHWHRWPISNTFTDNLVPSLVKEILDTPIRMNEGELVVVRRDESTLEGVEKGILTKLRAAYRLCEIPNVFRQVTAYRIALTGDCDAGS